MRHHLLLFALSLPCTLWATVWHVQPPQSIQQTVNAAQNGDTILLADGNYYETVILYGKSLTIGSGYLLDGDTTHIANTTVHAQPIHPDTGSCFVHAYGEADGRLEGVTLTDGIGTKFWDGHSLYMVGGGVVVCSSRVNIRQCRILDCSARIGAGVGAISRRRAVDTHVELSDCVIQDCIASYWGGGFGSVSSAVNIERCVFVRDSAPSGGGGIHVMEGPASIRESLIRRCRGQTGGLVYVACSGEITNCVFDSNATRPTYQGPCHMSIIESPVVVTGCLFRHNTADFPAIQINGKVDAEPLRFWGNVVEENFASTVGGTIYAYGIGWMEIGYCLIRNNTNLHGGAIIVQTEDPRLRIHHNVIENNRTLQYHNGSAILLQQGMRVVADSNWIAGNSAPAVGLIDQRWRRSFANNYWGDPSGPYHPTLNPTGLGDTLYQDSIIFTPWLTSPPDTTMPDLAIRERPEVAATWRLIAVYPNPFNSTVRLIVAGFSSNDFAVTLHNLLGQEVAVLHRGPLTGGEILFTAPQTLASGVYFLRAADRLSSETRKVILLR